MPISIRVLRYGVVGTMIAVLYSSATVLFVSGLHVPSPTLGSILAFVAVLPVAYIAHRRVTFSDTGQDVGQPRRFVVTNTVGFIVTTTGMFLLTDVFGFSYGYGIALNWTLIPAANFLIYLTWVFSPGHSSEAAGAPAFERR